MKLISLLITKLKLIGIASFSIIIPQIIKISHTMYDRLHIILVMVLMMYVP